MIATFAPRKECAHAFCDAVLEITQLHFQGWGLLDTLVLVDINRATVAEYQQVFSDAILSGYLQQFVNLEEAGPDTGTSGRTGFVLRSMAFGGGGRL